MPISAPCFLIFPTVKDTYISLSYSYHKLLIQFVGVVIDRPPTSDEERRKRAINDRPYILFRRKPTNSKFISLIADKLQLQLNSSEVANPDYVSRCYWHVKDAYEDFKNNPLTGNWLPDNDYPMEIQQGEVYAIRYTMSDGSVHMEYMRTDGNVWDGMMLSEEFTP